MHSDSEIFSQRATRPDNFVAFDPAEIEGSLGQRLEKIVALHPERIAYEDDTGLTLTYTELNAAINKVANHLLDRWSAEPNTPALLLFGFNERALIASLALKKIGWISVVLDDAYPQARLEYMIADSQADILLTETSHHAMAESLGLSSRLIINIDEILAHSDEEGNPEVDIAPDTTSHILYSSGSTGQPKGIMQSQQNILHLVCYMTDTYGFAYDDSLSLLSALSYGNSIMQVYAPLLIGAKLLPYNVRALGLQDMPEWIRRHGLTCIASNTTTLRRICMELKEGETLPGIRMMATGGEAVRYNDVQLIRKRMPHCILGANYGTSEALWMTACFANDLSRVRPDTSIPAGYRFGEHEILLVDEDRQPVSTGEIGEFAARGKYLSAGYWGKPDLTERVFVQDAEGDGQPLYLTGDLGQQSEDGLYYHLGRRDHQLKVRGFRVEPGEVESALLSIEGVREAAVFGKSNTAGDTWLVGYVVANEGVILLDDHLRSELGKTLPDFLIPERFVYLDGLPRTISGKIDKQGLPEPSTMRPELSTPYAKPRDDLEAQIAGLWASVFGLDRVGIHDDFFALGGHSLMATQLVSRVSDQLELTLFLDILFAAPTVADMAEAVRRLQDEGAPDREAKVKPQTRDDYRQPHDAIYGDDPGA